MIYSKIAIIGIGLIGASVAIAAKHKKLAGTISCFDANDEARVQARELGIGDEVSESITACVSDADLVMLAVPVGAMKNVMEQIADDLKPGCVVTYRLDQNICD